MAAAAAWSWPESSSVPGRLAEAIGVAGQAALGGWRRPWLTGIEALRRLHPLGLRWISSTL